jgi:hypothetical protein
MRAIYEVFCSDGMGWLDVCTEFHEDWFSHPEVVSGEYKCKCTQQGDVISLRFFLIRKVG